MTRLACLSLFIIFISCARQPLPIDDGFHFGYGKAMINGVPWTSKARASLSYSNPDSLIIILNQGDSNLINAEIGFYKLSTRLIRQRPYKAYYPDMNKWLSALSYISKGQDSCFDLYNVLESDSLANHITVTSWDPVTREIRGNFQVTMIVETNRARCNVSGPDTVRFTNGEFYTKIVP